MILQKTWASNRADAERARRVPKIQETELLGGTEQGKKKPEDQGDLIFRRVVVAPKGTVKCVDIGNVAEKISVKRYFFTHPRNFLQVIWF
ncbi:MAG: hypothetical protein ACRD2H_05040 [Terriglobales bacterium]